MSDGWGFGDPRGPGDQFQAKEHIGDLVAFVEGKRDTVDTVYGENEVTICRYVVVLDGDDEGLVYDDPIVFGNLGRAAYNPEDKIVLGRVGVGQAKKGQNPPYILEPATDEDKAIAGAWFDQNAAINSVGAVIIG